ncbi:FAD-linked reductase [Ramaria rubella]|nr:FAD-linked reductase [Ramaria rubella]
MRTYLEKQKPDSITFNSRVDYIGVSEDNNNKVIEVKVHNTTNVYKFSQVISTIPLPVLRTVDLSKADLSPMQSNALRQLDYGPSVKVGMQFRTAWWTLWKDLDGNPLNIVGGQTYTDRPLRTIVYPSFGDVHGGKTTTLIASYCWTEDSIRLGALIGNNSAALSKLVLKELADIHNVDLQDLTNQLIDTKAWSWSQDPCTMGAFAFFGPGKFRNVYTSLNSPAAQGSLHFAGEALSVRHAWVEGALDSAWRAICEMLMYPPFNTNLLLQKKFTDHWGTNPEWIKAAPPKQPPRRGPTPHVPDNSNGVSPIFSSSDSLLYQNIALDGTK